MTPQQHDPNGGRTVCAGWFVNRPCDSLGIIPFERSRGHFVLLCRLCHYQETVDAKWQTEKERQRREGGAA